MLDEIHDVAASITRNDIWNEIVNLSPEGWFWATEAMHEFRVAHLQASKLFIADRSFILLRGGRPCALVPLVICREATDGDVVASYLNTPLPWPMVVAEIADRESITLAILNELEARVVAAKATMLRLMLAPPGVDSDMAVGFGQVVRERAFIDASYQSHYVAVNPSTPNTVRTRYRRNVRKFWEKYRLDILGPKDIPQNLAQIYMELHIKDSGRFSRPLVTYERQVGLVRSGEGFWIIARNIADDRIAGMLLVSLYKGAAYDNSVAVDPEYADDSVAHLMKWKAIEYLIECGVSHYELGVVAFTPSYMFLPSEKNYGISFFKDGWARGRTKHVWVAEKFYARDAFDKFWDLKRKALHEHFSI
jgi:Acetyltransferase (GNAT) domain